MTIRPAQSQDIPRLIALLCQIGDVHHGIRPDIFRYNAVKYSHEQLEELLKDEKMPIFVCDDGGSVVGYCLCQIISYKNSPVLTDRTELYIDDLCVDESRRGQGIGSRLYDYALSYAKEIGCQFLTLNVWSGNDGAIRFYDNAGMTKRCTMMEMKRC